MANSCATDFVADDGIAACGLAVDVSPTLTSGAVVSAGQEGAEAVELS